MRSDQTNVTQRRGIKFKILAEDQIREIQARSLEVLDRTGVLIGSEPARSLLADAGCRIRGEIVKFPPGLVEWAIAAAPSHFWLHDRTGEQALDVGGHKTYFGLGPTLLYMIDPVTGKPRKFVKAGTERAARLTDALAHIDWVMGLGTISDCDPQYADRHEFDALVRNTTKPTITWAGSTDGVRDIIKMAETIAGGGCELRERPFITFFFAPTSPLAQDATSVDKLLLTTSEGIPTVYAPAPQGGASAPVTLAGELVSTHAENLASLTIAQVSRPGAPIAVGGVIGTMDMRAAQLAYGAPEMQLMLAAYNDIAKHYGIPTWGTAGCSDAKVIDQQAAMEATQSVLYSLLSGINLVHDVGYIGSGTVGSLELITMVDEVIGMAKYMIPGIRVDEPTLALDAIDRASGNGQFLTSPHTLAHFRDQLWTPTLMDRQSLEKWRETGSKAMRDRVAAKLKSVLKTHDPAPLPRETLDQLQAILPE